MRRAGFKLEFISSAGDYLDTFAQVEGVSAHAIEMKRSVSPVQDVVALIAMLRVFRRVRPTIVHSHTPKAGMLGMIAAWVLGVRVRIYHMRGLPVVAAAGFRRVLLTLSEKVACRLAHHVLCVSPSVREVAIARGLAPSDKITVLAHGSGNGVDARGRFNPELIPAGTRQRVRTDLGIPADAFVIGFIGRVVRQKGIVELSSAWIQLRSRYDHLYLLMVGPIEPQDPIPNEVLESLSQDERVSLIGLDWDTPRYYSAMDLFVLPTYREGFPNGILEASAMGLPVVSTRVPGCVDAVADGLTGTLVPARDQRALATAIARYVESPEQCARDGTAGRERVLTFFRPELIWEALLQFYNRLLNTEASNEKR